MRDDYWSSADVAVLIDLLNRGKSPRECARELGMRLHRIKNQASALRKKGLVKPVQKSGNLPLRRCLVHGGMFTPTHRTNFICPACTQTEKWQAG
ncbi:MAG TPA: hypothetical protein VMF53_06700 [Alphaproteobacteria bacterium]|nr:hypothetical protein [Alphaproteobacteria bacterium]